jgi:lysozyme
MSLAILASGDGARSELGQDRMRPRYKVSQAGVDLIEAFEGFRPKSARLADGGWTIGYGHTRSAREGAEISREDALILLRWVDLPAVEEAINGFVCVPLTQNQYDALVAFVFNVGVDAFQESDVLERLNEGRLIEAACALELWRKADISGDPVVLDALIRRRAAEKALFLALGEGVAPTPSPLVRPRPDARAAQFVPASRPAEIEAPLSGERAEVRLVASYEIEPELEAPATFAPEPVEPEPAAEPAPETEAPTAWTAAAEEPETKETPEEAAAPTAEPAPDEEAPSATAEPLEPEAEQAPDEAAASVAALAAVTALSAWAAEVPEVALPEAAVEAEPAPMAWITIQAPEQPTPEQPTPDQPTQEAAQAALIPMTAGAVDEAAREPASASWTAETPVAPVEEAPVTAPSAWAAEAVEQAEPEAAPTAWSIELPHAASVAPQEPTPAAWTAAPAETEWDEPAPSSWIIGGRPSEPAPVAGPAAAEPAVELAAAAEAEALAAADAAPVETPQPEEIVHEIPAVGSALQMRAVPEAAPRPRPLYSSYGPMAFAVGRPAPAAAAGQGAFTAPQPPEPQPAEPQRAEPQPVQGWSAQPQPAQGQWFQRQPQFQPLPGLIAPAIALEPAQPTPSFAPLAPAPASATADVVAAVRHLILTSPPADSEEPRAASIPASLAAETDELETPLFDEGWDGPGALSGRIVHHEASAEHDARASKRGVTGPYVLLGFIGFVAFGGALFAFSRGHAAGGGVSHPIVLAWILALIGAACVGISVYFLLKRLGGQED